jgi:RimJ/RimL family protein N-acetyltransferase
MSELQTERLRLRPFCLDDLDRLAEIHADPLVMRFLGGRTRDRAETLIRLEANIRTWHEHGFGMFAAFEKATGAMIGRCGLAFLDNTPEIELGYMLARDFWGHGYATEAARASLQFGFQDRSLARIVAVAHPENQASRHVIEKLGMRFEKNAHFYENDVVYYALTREAWQTGEEASRNPF